MASIKLNIPSFACANGPLAFDVVFPYLFVKDHIPSLQLTRPLFTSRANTPSLGAITKKSNSPYNTVLPFVVERLSQDKGYFIIFLPSVSSNKLFWIYGDYALFCIPGHRNIFDGCRF